MKLLRLFLISILIGIQPVLAYQIQDDTNKYTYKVNYYETPYPNVNEKIHTWLDKELEEFKQYENYNNIKNDFYTQEELHTYKNINYLQYTISSYTGGAHYGLEFKQFAYDDKGNFLELKDLFKSPDYLEILSSLSYKILLEEKVNEDKDWLQDGTKPIEENFSNFYLDEEGLHLTFPPYQVAPWASGTVKIMLPYHLISNYLK